MVQGEFIVTTNEKAKVILCYGDSNTYGRNPIDRSRYSVSTRWTGILQNMLGEDYYIIEEGLGGRTTDVDDPSSEGRNGFEYFKPCVQSHDPDIIVLMLGTNDVKDIFNRSAQQIADAIEIYFLFIESLEKSTKLILVSPSGVDMDAPTFHKYADKFSESSVQKADQLADLYKDIAIKYDSTFIDASPIVTLGEEGLHWMAESHAAFGKVIKKEIVEMRNK